MLGDPPELWAALGFGVEGGGLDLGGVAIELTGQGGGIIAWRLEGAPAGDLGGLSTLAPGPAPGAPGRRHANGAIGVDHVVALTGDLDRSVSALRAVGMEPRRIREAGPTLRQAFYVMGPALLELAGPVDGHGRAAFWGLTIVAEDLDALGERLGDRLGDVRPAVQPGRRIATLSRQAGLGQPVAFISPREGAASEGPGA